VAAVIERRPLAKSYSQNVFTKVSGCIFFAQAAGTNPSQQNARRNRSAQNLLHTVFLCDESSPSRLRKTRARKIPRAAQTPFRVVVAQSIVVAFSSLNLVSKNPHSSELSWLLFLLLEERSFSRRISPQDHVHSPARETGEGTAP
jgi:hypothetical protein